MRFSEAQIESRRASVPVIHYPDGLPVVDRRDDIAAAIRDHQVVIIAGETGSGKTTQIPKICLELGRGVSAMIGHTQPRRIAARAVAERVAEELRTPLGAVVGYKVRFTDRASASTLVKVMTDGILLAEMQQDRMLRGYDTIIVDEAHERSLNIDFILGYLKRLLPRRPDLKVIVTSATIDPERFSRHFGGAPIIEVSGRMYPVEIRYRPLVDDADASDRVSDGEGESDGAVDGAGDRAEPRDQITAICEAVDELCREGPGDILVFLSGEREIRDSAEALAGRALRGVEIVPLYARLSAAEQHRVFTQHLGRRVVLATNVAETSLTVPGIRYVVDPGTARISRYSHRTKVQRLPIEAISRASAHQRAGRCGRVEAGVCVRLYSEVDFLARPEFTEPEVLRTNLASVILRMADLRLGDIASFPFVEPPDRRQIRDGIALLEELGALTSPADTRGTRSGGTRSGGALRLSPVGRQLAALPVDPRIARMVVEAARSGCARDVIVIAAALSIVDPRERPIEHRQAADDRHGRFADPESDFLTYLNLWDHLREKQRELSSSKFRRYCRAEFLNYLRIREWQDVAGQLRQVSRGLGVRIEDARARDDERDTASGDEASGDEASGADPSLDEASEYRRKRVNRVAIQQALLAGLLSHIGMRDVETRDYLGARNARFSIFPGSALFKKQPRWVMSAEMVETNRLWGRVCARIEPEWIEPLAAHLVRRSYSEPHWDSRRGAVMAYEKVTLYGVPIVASRRVGYGKIDPALARELFIRHALVEGDWRTHHKFFHANRAAIESIAGFEDRVRRRDLLVDDETLFELYGARVGSEVVSARHFDSWWKKTRMQQPDLLSFDVSLLMTKPVDVAGFPDAWRQGELEFPLSYVFSPGADDDGVTARIPVSVLNQVRGDDFAWHIPGLREELITVLLRSLPKPLRRNFVPAPDAAHKLLAEIGPGGGSLYDVMSRAMWRMSGVEVTASDFDLTRLPDHLRVRFEIVDDGGEALAAGRSLTDLAARLAGSMRAAISEAAAPIERDGACGWEFGGLPDSVEYIKAGLKVRGFPAVVDHGETVGVRVFETESEAAAAHRKGVRRLLLLNVPSPAKALRRQFSNETKLALSRNAPDGAAELLDDCLACALDEIVSRVGGPPRDEAAFERALATTRAELFGALITTVREVVDILAKAYDVEKRLKNQPPAEALPAMLDLKNQLGGLVFRGFVAHTGARRLRDLPRYLAGIERRLDKVGGDVNKDRARMWEVEQAAEALADAKRRRPHDAAALDDVRWMIEELRVSLFAQSLGVARPVSLQRILRALD